MAVAVKAKRKSAIKVTFEDLLPGKNPGGNYVVPNESVEKWSKLIAGKSFDRAGAICSGGEVGFFSLLPSVREELVLVDHSYISMHAAIVKWILLHKHGFKTCLELLEAHSYYSKKSKWTEAVKGVVKAIPAEVVDGLSVYYTSSGREAAIDRISGSTGSIRTYWQNVPADAQDEIQANLDKVRFVHGDFLSVDGPFDLFYISNAAEFGNGNQERKNLNELSKKLNSGGYVLSSTELKLKPIPGDDYGGAVKPKEWELIEKAPSTRDSWKYCLYQKK